MKGKPEVLNALAKMLKEEIGALNQYLLHAEICDNWGYPKLAEATKNLSIAEMKHAEALIERILFLEGMPNLSEIPKLRIGETVPQQLENDLALELGAVADYNAAISAAREADDQGSAELLKKILLDEENHVDQLETQLDLIKSIGLENYLQQKLG